MDDWIKTDTNIHIYTFLPSETTWMNSAGHYAKQNKSDTERQLLHELTYTWNLKPKQQNQVHRYREQTGSCQKPGQVQGQGQKK